MKVELVQVILSIDGQLSKVIVPPDRDQMVIGLLQAVFDDNVIQVAKLPDDIQLHPLPTTKTPS